MKVLKSLAVIFYLFVSFCFLPVSCETEQTYLCVFSSIDQRNFHNWDKFKPEVECYAYTWKSFPSVLRIAREETSKDQVIDVVIDVHGGEYLAICPDIGSDSYATFGYVVNQIEKELKDRRVRLFCEACFGGNIYRESIRNNLPCYPPFNGECNHVPKFPIYGIKSGGISYGNVVYQQYYYHKIINFVDLREYEKARPRMRDRAEDRGLYKLEEDLVRLMP